MPTIELFSYADARPKAEAPALYREIVEQAVRADQAGYERLWLTEQHLTAPGHVPDSLMMLAFIAAKTTRLRLGTAVASASLHHPVRLIESAAQLDLLSNGRLDLGVGSGSEAGEILDVLGVDASETAGRTRELYEALAQAKPESTITFHGEYLDCENVALDPAPRRPLLELVWTGAGRSAIELASDFQTGLLLPRPMPHKARSELYRKYREVVPEGKVVHFKAGLVAPTGEEARRRAAGFVNNYARRYLGVENLGGPDSTDFAEAVDRLEFGVGSPTEVAERVRDWLADFDLRDGVAIQFGGPEVDQEHVLESIDLFASQIPGLGGDTD